MIRYAIFVHGLGPENQVNEEFGGYAVIEIPVEDNPLLNESNNETNAPIPDWIKNNAGWWADGTITDGEFAGPVVKVKRKKATKKRFAKDKKRNTKFPVKENNKKVYSVDASEPEDDFSVHSEN